MLLRRDSSPSGREIELSPGTKRLVERSVREALRLGGRVVGLDFERGAAVDGELVGRADRAGDLDVVDAVEWGAG